MEYSVTLPGLYIEGKEGRAIAVDLTKVANLPSTVPFPHMTVLYRQTPFSKEEYQAIVKEAERWIKDYNHGMSTVYFMLEPWGPRSKLIKGDLETFGQHLRDMFSLEGPQDRPLHVQLSQTPKF